MYIYSLKRCSHHDVAFSSPFWNFLFHRFYLSFALLYFSSSIQEDLMQHQSLLFMPDW